MLRPALLGLEPAVTHTATSQSSLGFDRAGARPALLPSGHPPVLLVVLDTEEEYDWSKPFDRRNTAVEAIQGLPLLQSRFEDAGLRPTYVIDYPVASTPSSAAVLAGIARRGVGEVGAHLHPWVTPPLVEEVSTFNSYGGNLSAELEEAKLQALVAAIESNVGVRPRTFKAGRYGIGTNTVASLRRLGFDTDLSSTPFFNWSGDGGPDFTDYPNRPYWMPGAPPLLEVPTTGGYFGPLRRVGGALHVVNNTAAARNPPLVGLLRKLRLARRAMLTPEGTELWELQALAESLLADGERVLSLSFHSPSVVPGHTAFVRSESDQSVFFERIERFASWLQSRCGAISLTASELRDRVTQP